MCYQTICLFSLCGHTSISQRSIRNVNSCQYAQAKQSQGRQWTSHPASIIQPYSSIVPACQALISPFPSPQEFEFARDLHPSLPASPTLPFAMKTEAVTLAERLNLATQATISQTPVDIIHIVQQPSPPPSPPPTSSPPSSSSFCPSPKSHPLHTFTVPQLCPPCHRQRLTNLARFEARAIRDSIDREETGHEANAYQSQGGKHHPSGIGGPERKQRWSQRLGGGDSKGHPNGSVRKVVRAKDGKLFPLICVEEGRICMEQRLQLEREERARMEGHWGEMKRNGFVEAESDGNGTPLDNKETGDVDMQPAPEMSGAGVTPPATVGTISAPMILQGTSNSTPSLSENWSTWWGRKPSPSPWSNAVKDSTTGMPTIAIFNTSVEASETERSLASGTNEDTPSSTRLIDPDRRSIHGTDGRNLKGMQRILGWERVGGGDGTTTNLA